MPKRPLSAYNLFFRRERQEILGEDLSKEFEITDQSKRKHRKTHGKIGFTDMARQISQKWKDLEEELRRPFIEQAKKEKEKYMVAKDAWVQEQKVAVKARTEALAKEEAAAAAASRWTTVNPPPMLDRNAWDVSSHTTIPPIDPHHGRFTETGARQLHSMRSAAIPMNASFEAMGGSRGFPEEMQRRPPPSMNPAEDAYGMLSDQERIREMRMHLERAAALQEEIRRNTGASNAMMDELRLPIPPPRDGPGPPGGLPTYAQESRRFNSRGGSFEGLGGNDWYEYEQQQQQQQQQRRAQERAEMMALQRQQQQTRHRPDFMALEQRRRALEQSMEIERRFQMEEEMRRRGQRRGPGGNL
jgi:hypothetical protein